MQNPTPPGTPFSPLATCYRRRSLIGLALVSALTVLLISVAVNDVVNRLGSSLQACVEELNVTPPVLIMPGEPRFRDEEATLHSKPTANQVLTAAMWGIDFSELDSKNENDESLSTTVIEALDNDLAASEQNEAHSQNLYVCNHDSAAYMCIGSDTWAGSCGSGDVTCRSGAVTDGAVIKPSSCRSLRLLGTERPCMVGTAAVSGYDVERVTNKGTEY